MAPSGGGPRAWANGERLGHGHAMRYAMGGAQENHGLLTQNAQQQSMGQGRLHGGVTCGALGRHGPFIQVGHGGWVCWDFPTL